MSDTPDAPKTLAEALLAAQAEMPAVERDQENPHFKSKFTSLDNLLSKVRPVLNRNGLTLLQAPDLEEGKPVLRTIILHSSGEQMAFAAPLSPGKDGPQAQGAAITYMRRYAAAAILTIADQEDDDGGRPAASSEPLEPLDDEEGQQLIEQAKALRDEIQDIDSGALGNFDNALKQRWHAADLLREFISKLTELLADVRRFEELESELANALNDEAAWKKVVATAQRRASRRERVEVLEKALAEAKGGEGDN